MRSGPRFTHTLRSSSGLLAPSARCSQHQHLGSVCIDSTRYIAHSYPSRTSPVVPYTPRILSTVLLVLEVVEKHIDSASSSPSSSRVCISLCPGISDSSTATWVERGAGSGQRAANVPHELHRCCSAGDGEGVPEPAHRGPPAPREARRPRAPVRDASGPPPTQHLQMNTHQQNWFIPFLLLLLASANTPSRPHAESALDGPRICRQANHCTEHGSRR